MPKISEESKAHVHHMLVYQCTVPPQPDWSAHGACHTIPQTIRTLCRGTSVLAGWAIGGEVNAIYSLCQYAVAIESLHGYYFKEALKLATARMQESKNFLGDRSTT